mmetsp:Transcript_69942/g.121048  ORF Transcript_69942/g.121048 Transcript_69942/m.121048 type:complete len:111 (-) Transcript_69942:95-427(-)
MNAEGWHHEYGSHAMQSWRGNGGFQPGAYSGEEAYQRWHPDFSENSEVHVSRQGANYDPYAAQYAHSYNQHPAAPMGSPVGMMHQRSVDMRQETWFGPDREDEALGCIVS